MTIKELFGKAENGTLTLEQFQQLAGSAKFVDLTEGAYVSKNKYTEDLQAKDTEIEGLKTTISTRDTDLKDLKQQLKDAGTDASKLSKLSEDLGNLQNKYDVDTQALQQKLSDQAYEFAVREFAGTKKFTSNAAKRDFINSMLAAKLSLDKDNPNLVIGAEDFVTKYSTNNSDAFVVEQPQQQQESPKPQFVAPVGNGQTDAGESNAFIKAFNFTGVRPMPNQN